MSRLIAVTLTLFSIIFTEAISASVDREFTFGILAFRDKETVSHRWEPLQDLLNTHVDKATFKIKPMYFDELEKAVANREIDYVLTNPSFYVYLQERYGLSSPLLTLLNQEKGKNLKAFGGVIFAKSDNEKINTLNDLAGKTAAIVNHHSLGGYQMQAFELENYQKGLSKELTFTEMGMPHDNALHAVLSGKVDVGFVRTGILEKLENEGVFSISKDLKIVNQQKIPAYPLITSTQLYPEWPLASLPNTDQQTNKKVLSVLLKIQTEDPVAKQMSIGGFDIPESYSSVTKLMRSQRLPPFDQIQDVSLLDIWSKYRLAILITAASVALLFLALLALLSLSRQLVKARQQIEFDKENLSEIIWATQAGTWTWNIQTAEVKFNERWANMLGYTLSELEPIGFDTWRSLVHPDDFKTAQSSLEAHLSGTEKHYQHEVRMLHKEGYWVWVLTKGNVVERDESGKALRVSGTHTDITERKTLESEKDSYSKQLEILATKDSLTSIHNRRYFMDSSQKLFDISERYNQPISCLMIDADNFKKINDTYGHDCGDNVLIQISEILESNVRQADLLARIGGEEFALLMPNTIQEDAYVIADRIAEVVKQQVVQCNDSSVRFSVSIGLAEKTQDIHSLSELMITADKALYQVKSSGKGYVQIYQASEQKGNSH